MEVPGRCENSDNLVLPAGLGDRFGFGLRCCGREIVGQQAAEFDALIEGHVHEFEGHVLRTVIAEKCRSLQAAHAELKFKLDRSSGMHVAVNGGDPASETGRANFQAAIFLRFVLMAVTGLRRRTRVWRRWRTNLLLGGTSSGASVKSI